MKELTNLEEKILYAIASTYPFTLNSCIMIYRRCDSFDLTIKVLKESSRKKISPNMILEMAGI